MALPKTRSEFINAVMLELGHPVLELNLDMNQIEHIVNKCINTFQLKHFDGSTEEFFPYKLTAQDITNGYLDLTLNDDIIYVEDILKISYGSAASVLNANFIMNADMVWNAFRAGSIIPYTVMQQYRATIEYELVGKTQMRFNFNDGKVFIDTDWTKFGVDDIIVLVCDVAVNPDISPRMWRNTWLLDYTRWSIQMQWGQNLIKYTNVELPGGNILNADKIYEEAKAKLVELEEKLKAEGQLPLDFFLG